MQILTNLLLPHDELFLQQALFSSSNCKISTILRYFAFSFGALLGQRKEEIVQFVFERQAQVCVQGNEGSLGDQQRQTLPDLPDSGEFVAGQVSTQLWSNQLLGPHQ